jgi:hypothetical protein
MTQFPDAWNSADLEARLCHALDIASRAVDALGEEGYAETGHEEDRIRPEKVVAETALLLLAAYVASGGADCVAARGGIRRRVHQLAEKLAPIARSERMMLAVCLQPSLALDFAAAHIYLTRIGYPDLRFDRILHETLWSAPRPAKERTPHRALEQEWLLWMGSVPQNSNGREQALRQSALAQPMDLLNGTRDDVYAFTHTVLYGRDLDCLPIPLPRTRDEVLGEAEAALARCLDEEDYDLAGELLLAWPYTANPKAGGPVWSAAATFGFEVLTRVEDRAGFLPSPGTRVDKLRSLLGEERRKYFLATAYHTVYVMGLVCAAALGPGKAPPARVLPGPLPKSTSRRLLAHVEPAAQVCHWYEQFRLLDLEQQDALSGLVFRIALRRQVKAKDYAGVAALLSEADALGLSNCPMAAQAAELLARLEVLAETIGARRAPRARGAAA